MVVDHINHDTLDNRRINLRICTKSQNQWNRRVGANSSTGVKGVSHVKSRGKYRAEIRVFGKRIHLGWFDQIDDAAYAYRQAARIHFGEFCCVE
ncbi:HNH endonuclease [Cupriavidus respiraculi]|uniref:HNH endonuclease n=1 Tax=Cupriavidus respiraculi TaxID=195930 RepID=UPI00398AF7E7